MRRTLTSVLKWASRGWLVVGLALVAFVVLEGMYRVARKIRNPRPDREAVAELPSNHPYAGQPWFKGWYEQPVVRGGIVYDPYRGSRKAPARTPFVNIDSAGRRVTVQAAGAESATRRLFLLGGSTMWGYTARDSFTIPSLVAAELKTRGIGNVEVVNLAQPGYNATQEVITLLLALRDGEVPAAAVFLTTHKDIAAGFQSGRAGGITSEGAYASLMEGRQLTLDDEIRALARHSALATRFASAPPPTGAPRVDREPSPTLCGDVARQYRALARIMSGLGREYGFPFIFLRQSLLATTKKPLSDWERTLPHPRYETAFRQCMATIDSTMSNVSGGAYLSLAGLFDQDTSSVFLDEYGYLTERAGGVVARRIVDLVEASLRRPAKTGSR